MGDSWADSSPGCCTPGLQRAFLPKGRQLACRGPGGRSDQGPRLGGQTSRIGTLPPDSWVWTAEQVHFCAVKGDYGTSVNDMTMLGGSFAKTLLERYACVHCTWSGASRVQRTGAGMPGHLPLTPGAQGPKAGACPGLQSASRPAEAPRHRDSPVQGAHDPSHERKLICTFKCSSGHVKK